MKIKYQKNSIATGVCPVCKKDFILKIEIFTQAQGIGRTTKNYQEYDGVNLCNECIKKIKIYTNKTKIGYFKSIVTGE